MAESSEEKTSLEVAVEEKKEEEKKEEEEEDEEYSLASKGFEVGMWSSVIQQYDLKTILYKMFEKGTNPNVVVRIGDDNYSCHMLVLQCYSELFGEYLGKVEIILPQDRVTVKGFLMVYDWMMSEGTQIKRDGITELLSAAEYLCVKELEAQCWIVLDDINLVQEDTAFCIYLEATPFDLKSVEELMLRRVGRFFLMLVASNEFVELPLEALRIILLSDTFGVNSEIETFMAAIRWLNENWEERKKHVVEVMSCVRFGLMPLGFVTLMSLKPESVVEKMTQVVEVKAMINDGVAYRINRESFGRDGRTLVAVLRDYNLELPLSRNWLMDINCEHHHSPDCPNIKYLCYSDFLSYLGFLQDQGGTYWTTFQLIGKDTKYEKPCCIAADKQAQKFKLLHPLKKQQLKNLAL